MQLVLANPLIWVDSAGWTGWKVLTALDEWKKTVLVEVKRVKMAVWLICWSTLGIDWII